MMCVVMRCLLDKNIVRYALAGLYYGQVRPLSPLEMGALTFWKMAEHQDLELFISCYSFNVLQRLGDYDGIRILLAAMKVLSPTRYHARWARRIRETSGLTREDAAMLALATFGTDQEGGILSTHYFVTYDQPLINGYRNHWDKLDRRFRAMTAQLPFPFSRAKLPSLRSPDSLIAEWL